MRTATIESKQLSLFSHCSYHDFVSLYLKAEFTLNTNSKCCLALLSSENSCSTGVIGVFGGTSSSGENCDCVRARCAYFTIVSVARLAIEMATVHIDSSFVDCQSFEPDFESWFTFAGCRSYYQVQCCSELATCLGSSPCCCWYLPFAFHGVFLGSLQ